MRNFGPGIGLPLGPRVEASNTCGPSGSVSRRGAVGCFALIALATSTTMTAMPASERFIELITCFPLSSDVRMRDIVAPGDYGAGFTIRNLTVLRNSVRAGNSVWPAGKSPYFGM